MLSSSSGWAALCANPYDLLITDHLMPKITGLDLVRRLRAVPLALPCILISGELPWHEGDLSSLLQPGAAMEKPFSLRDLLAKAKELLTGSPVVPLPSSPAGLPTVLCAA